MRISPESGIRPPGDAVDDRRLAGPVVAEQSQHLAPPDLEAHLSAQRVPLRTIWTGNAPRAQPSRWSGLVQPFHRPRGPCRSWVIAIANSPIAEGHLEYIPPHERSVRVPEYVVRADTTPPADLSGTAFSHLDVRWLVNEERNGAELTGVGQTIYPAHGGTHEVHLHPKAEEVVIVQSGRGRHLVGDHLVRHRTRRHHLHPAQRRSRRRVRRHRGSWSSTGSWVGRGASKAPATYRRVLRSAK